MPDPRAGAVMNTAKVDTRSPVSGRLTLTPPNESLAISPGAVSGGTPESAGLRSADAFLNNSSEKFALACYFLFAASYQYAAAILLLCYFVRSGSSVEGKTLSAGSVGDPVEYGGAEMRKRNEPARDLHDASTEARRPRRCFGLFRGFSEDARGRSRTKKKGAKVGSGARNRGGRGIVQAAAMGARVESCKADFPTARASSDKYHAAASNRRVPKRQKSEPRQSPAKAVDHFRGDREFGGGSLTVGAGNQPSVGAGNFVEWSSTKFPDQTDQLGGESSPRIRQSDQSDRGYNIDASVLSTYGGGYDFQTKLHHNLRRQLLLSETVLRLRDPAERTRPNASMGVEEQTPREAVALCLQELRRLLLSAAGTTASSSSKPVGGGPYRSSFFPLGNPMVSRANSENVMARPDGKWVSGAADCHHQQLLSASGEGLGLRDSQTSLGRPGAPPASPRGAASLSAEQFASSGYMKSAGDHGGAGEVEVEGQADAYALREAAGEEEEGGGGTSTTNSRALVCSAAREEVGAFAGPIPASRGGEAGDLDRTATTPVSCEYLLTQQKILADAAAQLIERFEGMRAAREEGLTSENKLGGFRQQHLLLRQASKGSAAGFSSASAADGPFYFAGGGTTTSSMPFLLRGSQQPVSRNLLDNDELDNDQSRWHKNFRSWFLFLLWPIYVFATVFALPCHLWWRGLKEKRRIDQQGIFDERNPPSHWADEVEARQHCSAEINKAPRSNPGQTTSPPLLDQGCSTSRVNGVKVVNGENQMLTLANYRKQKNSIVNSNSSARERGDPLQHFNQRSSCSQMDMSVVENLAQPVMMAMSSYVGGAPRQRDYSTKRSGSGVGTMMHRDDNRRGAAGAYLDSPMILNSLLHSVSERVAGAISEFFEDNADKRKI
eukprot:g16885.t1